MTMRPTYYQNRGLMKQNEPGINYNMRLNNNHNIKLVKLENWWKYIPDTIRNQIFELRLERYQNDESLIEILNNYQTFPKLKVFHITFFGFSNMLQNPCFDLNSMLKYKFKNDSINDDGNENLETQNQKNKDKNEDTTMSKKRKRKKKKGSLSQNNNNESTIFVKNPQIFDQLSQGREVTIRGSFTSY